MLVKIVMFYGNTPVDPVPIHQHGRFLCADRVQRDKQVVESSLIQNGYPQLLRLGQF